MKKKRLTGILVETISGNLCFSIEHVGYSFLVSFEELLKSELQAVFIGELDAYLSSAYGELEINGIIYSYGYSHEFGVHLESICDEGREALPSIARDLRKPLKLSRFGT